MAKVISDNKFDFELESMKKLFSNLSQKIQRFTVVYKELPIKERTEQLIAIQKDLVKVGKFVSTPNPTETINSGTKFGLENLRSSYRSLLVRWQRFERSL